MESIPQSPDPLDYASRSTKRNRRAARFIGGMPLWLIALLLLLPIWILDHFNFSSDLGSIEEFFKRYGARFLYFAALFLPGSIKRLNWRQVLIMLPLSAASWALDLGWSSFKGDSEVPLLFGLEPAMAIVGVTLSEQLFLPKRSGKSIVWAIAIALAAGCTVAFIDGFLNFTGRTSSFELPAIGGWYQASWAYLLYSPLVALLAWTSIPLAQKLPLMRTRSTRLAGGAMAVSLIAIYFLFFQVWMYSLAIDALRGSGPFSRGMAVAILKIHDNSSVRQELWHALETADWSQPQSYTGGNEYRRYCIDVLAARDPGGTARRLAEMLRKNPSKILARFSAKLLGDEKVYGTVPILTRYALLDEDTCTRALESMHLPVAALAILRHAAIWHVTGAAPAPQNFPLDPSERTRLEKLLDKDAGPNSLDWAHYYDQVANTIPSPLSPDQTTETQKVTDAFISYWNATQRLENAADKLFSKLLADDGRSDITQKLRAMIAGTVPSDPAVVDTAEHYLTRARKQITVAPPNWDAPDTSALEKQVQQYSARVDTMIAQYRDPPATSTAP